MRTTPGRLPSRPNLLFLLLLSLASATAAAAQQTTPECRCVDADGNPIENCRCFRMPSFQEPMVRMFGAPRARIGVSLEENADGARIREVAEDSPAADAGLQAGDVITRVEGRSLLEPLADAARERRIDETGDVAVQRLMAMAQDWEVGTAVEVEYLRGAERRTVEISPEENPARFSIVGGPGRVRVFGDGDRPFVDAFGPDGRARVLLDSIANFEFPREAFRFSTACRRDADALVFFGGNCVDGVHLVELNPELGGYFGATSGVLVTEVDDSSNLGLQAGDVLLSIDGRAVTTPEQVTRILSSYSGSEEIRIRIRRHDQETEVTGTRR
jgi:predicted metalloprotease with PDZ domain